MPPIVTSALARSSRLRLLAAAALAAVLAVPGCGETTDAPKPADGGTTKGGMKSGMKSGMAESGQNAPPSSAGAAQAQERRTPPAFRFSDHTAASGITAVNHSGTAGVKEYLFEAVGPGFACLDFDRDGWMDVYVPDGDVFDNYDLVKESDPKAPGKVRPVLRPKPDKPKPLVDHLYRNKGDGTFEDVALAAGVADDRWSFGALAWDYDGDGWTDLFVSNLGACRLYHNQRNGTFRDVAPELGLVGDATSWNSCASCGDYDGDGRLDLFVARYADPAMEIEKQRVARKLAEGTPVTEIPGRACLWRGLPAYCGPVGLVGQHDSLYRQQEDGTFRDVTEEVGMVPKAPKYGFTSYFFDYDDDGLLDVYVANDSEENFLWKQSRDKDGKIRFRDVSEELGVKFGQNQNPQASMGCTTADLNRDGLLDIFVTNFSHDYNNIFIGVRYPGGVSFKDRGQQTMGQAVFYDLSWGCGFYDFDLDADLDLFVANGHVYKEVDLFDKTGTAYEQYSAVFECLDAAKLRYREVGPKPFKGPSAKPPAWLKPEDVFAGDGLEVKKCNRTACFHDFDNDGDVDVLVGSMNETPTFLRNDLPADPSRRWLKLLPRGEAGNVEGIGAVVRVATADGVTQTFPVFRCQSFLGTDDPRIPVGVGAATTATVTVVWPGPVATRKTTVYKDVATNAAYELHVDGTAQKLELKTIPSGGK